MCPTILSSQLITKEQTSLSRVGLAKPNLPCLRRVLDLWQQAQRTQVAAEAGLGAEIEIDVGNLFSRLGLPGRHRIASLIILYDSKIACAAS